MADAWTDAENRATVEVYFRMLSQELTHQSYTKKQYIDEVATVTGRGTKAVEYKFQNVSAVLLAMRAPWVDGYKPARNYQHSLAPIVADMLMGDRDLQFQMEAFATAPAAPRVDLSWDVAQKPDVRLSDIWRQGGSRIATPRDFVQIEAANGALGLAGERAVVEFERNRLKDAGEGRLAERVRHASQELGDGLGYDIESFELDGSPRFIEVKTTRRGIAWPMFISRNEVEVSRVLGDTYHLYRVYRFAKPVPGLYQLRGAIDSTCDLDPQSYAALPAVSIASA